MVLATGATAAAQDADADAAKAELTEGIRLFEAKAFQEAQAALLKANAGREALDADDVATLDLYLQKVRPAITGQQEARSALAAAQKALGDNDLDAAERHFAAAAASEFLDDAARQQAKEQLAQVRQRKELADAMDAGAETRPADPPPEAGDEPDDQAKPAPEADGDGEPAADDAATRKVMAEVKARLEQAKKAHAAGVEALDAGRYEEAAEHFEKALELAPGRTESLEGLKRAMRLSGVHREGKELTARVIQDNKVRWQAALTQIDTAVKRALELVAKKDRVSGDFEAAESACRVAENILRRAKPYAPAAAYRDKLEEIQQRRRYVRQERQAWERAEQQRIRQEAEQREADRRRREKLHRIRKIGMLTSQAEALREQRRYAESLEVVKHILKLDADNRFATNQFVLLDELVSMRKQSAYRDEVRRQQRDSLVDIQQAETPWYELLRYPPNWREITARREPFRAGTVGETQADREVRESLKRKIRGEVAFENTPLPEAIDFLRRVSGLSIFVKWTALEGIGITREDATVREVNLEDVTVEKALRTVLEDVGAGQLDLLVDEGVVTISTRDDLALETVTRVYDIRDLIIEIRDFDAPRIELARTQITGDVDDVDDTDGGLFPDDDDDDDEEKERKTKSELTEEIMRIIRDTVAPGTWRGGDIPGDIGSIRSLHGQLVVTHTPATHLKLLDLIDQLREAKAIQIAFEARFISVSTGFLNNIGLDLDLYFNIGSRLGSTTVVDPWTGATVPAIKDPTTGAPSTSGWGVGKPGEDQLTPMGINQRNFEAGGFTDMIGTSSPVSVGSSIGTSITSPSLSVNGSFLDDVQVNFLIQATQAHQATRSLTAPRITLFNGQRSYVTVGTQQVYIADLEPVISENAIAFNPVIGTVPTGSVLEIVGTVSADRRYVTMEVSPQIALLNGFTSYFISVTDTDANGNPLTGTGQVQLPNVTVQELRTTVSVPDGGTLLLGGQRVSGQVEREKGVPLLSKLPIIKRLFTNRGQVRDETTLLILIKPKIIIQPEEEEKRFPEG
jgi:type II secretory pathway component GspD/PulD (secretin)